MKFNLNLFKILVLPLFRLCF